MLYSLSTAVVRCARLFYVVPGTVLLPAAASQINCLHCLEIHPALWCSEEYIYLATPVLAGSVLEGDGTDDKHIK